ncbi:MAG: hypothetical protein M1833_003909 [Piccolia ochrophora]|nr:MAG: hypothetical protein M1833_003909 [Piccolia ochrophora]
MVYHVSSLLSLLSLLCADVARAAYLRTELQPAPPQDLLVLYVTHTFRWANSALWETWGPNFPGYLITFNMEVGGHMMCDRVAAEDWWDPDAGHLGSSWPCSCDWVREDEQGAVYRCKSITYAKSTDSKGVHLPERLEWRFDIRREIRPLTKSEDAQGTDYTGRSRSAPILGAQVFCPQHDEQCEGFGFWDGRNTGLVAPQGNEQASAPSIAHVSVGGGSQASVQTSPDWD